MWEDWQRSPTNKFMLSRIILTQTEVTILEDVVYRQGEIVESRLQRYFVVLLVYDCSIT